MSKDNEIQFETDVNKVLLKDGIEKIDLLDENQEHTKFSDLKKISNNNSWVKRVVYNEIFAAHLICQKPGETNRTHFHKKDDEWWVVLEGKIIWWIDGKELLAKQGDIVFVPRGKNHKIKTIGSKNSIRLAISPPDIPHYHPKIDPTPDEF